MGVISECHRCGGPLKHYDHVKRIVKTKNGEKMEYDIPRSRCIECGYLQRQLPEDHILRHKQYDAEIIKGVVKGYITSDIIGFEDYPCELTMKRWKNEHSKRHGTNDIY